MKTKTMTTAAAHKAGYEARPMRMTARFMAGAMLKTYADSKDPEWRAKVEDDLTAIIQAAADDGHLAEVVRSDEE